MHMPEGEAHPSTLPGFRVTRDSEQTVTRSRSERKKKRVEFKDVQQPIPNPPQENYPQRFITQLLDDVNHIYYTGKELTVVQYDWGFAIRVSLYHGLNTAVTAGGAITGFSQLLEYWFYVYCGVGQPIVKERLSFRPIRASKHERGGTRRKTNDQDLHLRKGRDIWVVPLLPGGGARMR
ncbi:hypothetical protein GIB67_025213 [Kingdonia uniflora]|uniref:Uncharacterized protein n=1 Tax=Kingdonia uniflora TaxID=39325 RepID=A0A7J7N7Y9_9MAGN|nr:hypothetical protein GIB67_025213 [Kingdonia uniflora]